ncbi:MAG: hypothetical protein N2C12_03010 [Planctomycetales bacterium]
MATGSIATNRPGFYKLCLEAFGRCDLQIVMSVGSTSTLEALGPIPSNCIVRPFVPQFELLSHCDLFLTHCGMGSISEGLYHAVPFLLYPQTPEQKLVSHQVAELGVGRRLHPADLDPQRLARRVEDLINDRELQARSKSVAQSMRGSTKIQQAVEGILQIASESP